MSINQSGWRPEMNASSGRAAPTFTGNKALMLEEALIFEIGSTETTGVDFSVPANAGTQNSEGGACGSVLLRSQEHTLGSLFRSKPIGLPGLSEPEAVRHYTRLSRQNYAIDLGLF
ncbi:MAG TPA: aminomethyl-transferring glycine dehydrogenase subunit GcvPB, partial [Sphingomonas sp.]|nr:aminomethyl-transferring glycine dehydrogenase subunit GcvPB [Sphingomonas sp.]